MQTSVRAQLKVQWHRVLARAHVRVLAPVVVVVGWVVGGMGGWWV
jgi:hypothetical protein